MKYNDFSALVTAIKAMSDKEKEEIVIWEDEGVVRVDYPEDEQIFEAEAINFVNAFFILLGVNVDDNISI
jgi:hypothetical protein